MACIGQVGACWVRRPFVQNAFGSFATWPPLLAILLWRWPLEEQSANAPRLRCATIFRACTGAKFSTKFSTAAVYQYTIVLVGTSILVVLNLVVHVPNIKMDYSSHGKFIILKYEYCIYFSTVRLFINQWSFWVAHCHQKCVRTEISGSAFFST